MTLLPTFSLGNILCQGIRNNQDMKESKAFPDDEDVVPKAKELVVYATTENGDGYVSEVGRYDSPEDVQIRIGLFAPEVVISFYWSEKEVKECLT